MNKETLDRLKNNPHYKLSSKQKEEAKSIERKPMKKFGDVEIHNNTPPIQKDKIVRKGKNDKKS